MLQESAGEDKQLWWYRLETPLRLGPASLKRQFIG